MSKNVELKKLIDEHYQKKGNYCYDGIVNEEAFEHAKIKILWVLKEPYIQEDNEKDVQKILENKEWYLNFLRDYHKNPTRSWQTWHRVIYTCYSILYSKEWNDIEKINNDNDIAEDVLNKIAIININKVPNTESTSSKTQIIKKCFKDNISLLEEQINIIKPNVVIWGFWNLVDHDLIEFKKFINLEECNWGDYYPYSKINKIIHILVDHPARIAKKAWISENESEIIDDEKYVNEIKNIVIKNNS